MDEQVNFIIQWSSYYYVRRDNVKLFIITIIVNWRGYVRNMLRDTWLWEEGVGHHVDDKEYDGPLVCIKVR